MSLHAQQSNGSHQVYCFAHFSVFVRQAERWYQVAPVHIQVHSYVLLQHVQLVPLAPWLQACRVQYTKTLYTSNASIKARTCIIAAVKQDIECSHCCLQRCTVYTALRWLHIIPLCDRCQHLGTKPVMQVAHVSSERH